MLGVLRAGLLSSVAFARQSYADVIVALNPIASWPLDEADGTTIIDRINQQNNGTYEGTVDGILEYGVEPIVENSVGTTAVGFDGSRTFGQIPHSGAFATPSGTIAFAVQPDSVIGQHLLVAKDAPGVVGGLTVDIRDGRLRAYLRDDTGVAIWLPDVDGAADIEVNTAHHVALAWGSRGAELWLDGQLVGSNAELKTGLVSNIQPLLLAAYLGPAALADVVMDEVAFFDRQLPQEQIATIALPNTIDHTSPLGQGLPDAPSADAYWVDPINGSDSATAAQARSSTTSPSSNPWKTLARAINEWNAGNLAASASGHVEIILRGGLSYERGNALTITRSGTSGSHLVIKGYRDDIKTGTRGGTGKFTGAKGRFVLRGNIQALEAGGWEDDPARGRNIYRSTATYAINGRARGNWLGANTHNLQLVPARGLSDLDTDNIQGSGSSVYSAPGVVGDSGRFYVRLATNLLTDHFREDFASPPTWVLDPNSERLAIYDDTVGLQFSGTISWVDLQFFNVEYWRRAISGATSSAVEDCTMDYVIVRSSFSSMYFQPSDSFKRWDITHCDFIANIPPWGERVWIHNTSVQGQWDGINLDIGADAVDDILFEHCRFIRCFDSVTIARHVKPTNITIRNCHFLNNRDDSSAFTVSASNITWLYNYWQDCFGACGMYHTSVQPDNRATWYVGFNVIDIRHYTYVNGHNLTSDDKFKKGTSGTTGGVRCGRVEAGHGGPNAHQERKWYHNTILCGKDANTNSGATDIFGWKSITVDTTKPSEFYNNVIIQIEDASFMGRLRANTTEMDYNAKWFDPAGDTFGSSSARMRPSRADGSEVGYSSWSAFTGSSAHYNETKHSNGQGPGSPQGWDARSATPFGDPDFVNGKWESIVRGKLSTYFPQVNGNLKFAVSLTATGWPETGSAKEYVGAFQLGDSVTKIGPEQGAWVD